MARDRALAAVVRDALVVAVIAVLVVQAMRRWCGDRYAVPSDSMQPVLNGDDRHGDVVFVDKLARAAACRRHDLVVVEHPDKPGSQLVKRIAARGDDLDGGCFIDIRDGDVWLGDRQRLERDTKDPLAAACMQVPWASLPGGDGSSGLIDVAASELVDGVWRLPPLVGNADEVRGLFRSEGRQERRRTGRIVPSGCIGTTRSVDASYLEATGARGDCGRDVGVRDCGMSLDLAESGKLLCTIDAQAQTLTFHVDLTNGRVELWCNGETVGTTTWSWRPQSACRFEFAFLDDRAYCVVDGRRDALFVVPRTAEWPVDKETMPVGPRVWLHVGVVGQQPLRIRGLRVFHDVFAWRERIAGFPGDPGQWPRSVPPGTWFLLGDNAFDSRDSRHFDARPLSTFIGRPRFVLGPWPRCRWLDS